MTGDDAGLNRFGYAVASAATLALAVLVVGGRSYAPYAGLLVAVAVACLAWAMRRTDRGRDRHNESQSDDEDEERKRREKEAEKAAHSGGGW